MMNIPQKQKTRESPCNKIASTSAHKRWTYICNKDLQSISSGFSIQKLLVLPFVMHLLPILCTIYDSILTTVRVINKVICILFLHFCSRSWPIKKSLHLSSNFRVCFTNLGPENLTHTTVSSYGNEVRDLWNYLMCLQLPFHHKHICRKHLCIYSKTSPVISYIWLYFSWTFMLYSTLCKFWLVKTGLNLFLYWTQNTLCPCNTKNKLFITKKNPSLIFYRQWIFLCMTKLLTES